MMDLPRFNPTDLIVEGVNFKRLKKHLVPISNFNFLEPLLNVPQSAVSQEIKGDLVASINDKQNVQVKNGSNVPCTLPKTRKKLQDKSLKVKTNHRKHVKTIDFPRIVDGHEATNMSDKKKTKVAKVPSSHQIGNQIVTTFPKPHGLDWALLQPSKDTGLQNKKKKIPCLICGDGFQPEKACKQCSSFCASILQGGSYLPMAPCSPEKMACVCYGPGAIGPGAASGHSFLPICCVPIWFI